MDFHQSISRRDEIDLLIAHSKLEKAADLIRQLWREEQNSSSASFIDRRISKLGINSCLHQMKLAIIRSFTIEPLVPVVRAKAFEHSLWLDIFVGRFGAYAQDILDPNSDLVKFDPDVVILAVQSRDLVPDLWDEYLDLTSQEVDSLIENSVASLVALIKDLRSRSSTSIIVHNFDLPASSSQGVFDHFEQGQFAAFRRLNDCLASEIDQVPGAYILDFDSFVAKIGRERWYDAERWQSIRMPMEAAFIPLLADEYLRYILPLSGRIAKCLVIDLDNTIWGGIIGEDGIDGIKIGKEMPGVWYRGLQRAIMDLYRRGIILAICSKNNERDAIEVLEQHPEMLLKLDHISAIRVNWSDKAKNLKEIAAELNIGVDSLAFLDDNPFERGQVRVSMPEVFVIDLPNNPKDFELTLRQYPAFERLALTNEDKNRGRLYADQRKRAQLQTEAISLEDYLMSLETKILFHKASSHNFERITQLLQKTNQFNLTSKRYTLQEIIELDCEPHVELFAISAQDKLGEYGLVGVVILRFSELRCYIDCLLLSCRVIGRAIEAGILSWVFERALARGCVFVEGCFVPTKKNKPFATFYPDNGFIFIDQTDVGHQKWELIVMDTHIMVPEWITMNNGIINSHQS